MAALFSAVIIWRHDAEALWALMGAVLNTGLSTVLKRVLNQERPVSNLRSDPGMPSSHAQSFFFNVIFVVVSCKALFIEHFFYDYQIFISRSNLIVFLNLLNSVCEYNL